MTYFRFSPVKDKDQLFKAIEYIHFESHKLCRKNLGYLLPAAGNIGFFCHYEDEFELLTNIRKELTDLYDNWNQKYYRLFKPIIIAACDDISETAYTYLYIRKPDPKHINVGDVDFYLEPNKYDSLRQSLLSGNVMQGLSIFERQDLNLIRLSDPKVDVSAFIGKKKMIENVREQTSPLWEADWL
jgi:hypothetical protein